jgi:hypothetical protein
MRARVVEDICQSGHGTNDVIGKKGTATGLEALDKRLSGYASLDWVSTLNNDLKTFRRGALLVY